MTDHHAHRTPSQVDLVANAHLLAVAQLDPLAATFMGLKGYDAEMSDFSPTGREALSQAARDTLTALNAAIRGADDDDASARAGASPVAGPGSMMGSAPVALDDIDRITVSALRERLGVELDLAQAGEFLAPLNNISSPLQDLREVFDLMPNGEIEAWENIAARLSAVPAAIDGYSQSLRLAASRGRVAALRQVEIGIAQSRELADPASSFFSQLVHGPAVDAVLDGSSVCAAVRRDLEFGARDAQEAYGKLADELTELAARAPTVDAVGEQRYALWSRYFLGTQVDLRDTYAWGVDELERISAEHARTATQIAGPGASVAEAITVLDADPALRLNGTEELRRWMQETSDAAIEALGRDHFEIPEPLRILECRIAPTSNGGIYYTGPSDDFSRPGRMWWSVPESVTSFSTWRERTTVYHEGVPGHHLQVGQAVDARSTLNAWRRLACWTSGYGEGWALYAEQLMADLGFLATPADRLGMLEAQRLRATRVVIDIGVHLQLPCPARWGGGHWDAAKAWELLRANVTEPEATLRFELDRYLGWPGQAPSYKVGQRVWEQLRDEASAAAAARGDVFDLKDFHARALAVGSVGLDTLRDALLD